MAYDLRFDVQSNGSETLDRIGQAVQDIGARTKESAYVLKVLEENLRANAAAGLSLEGSLKLIAKDTSAFGAAVSEASKEVLSANEAAQKLGRTMDIAYGQNRARDAKQVAEAQKQLTDELKKQAAEAEAAAKAQARAQAEAEASSNRTAGGLLRLASSTGLVSGQVSTAARGIGALSGGLAEVIGPATIAAAAIVGVGTAAYGIVKAYAEASNETDKFAARLGVSLSQARNLQNLGEVGGVGAEGLASASRYIATALEDEEGAGRKVAAALDRIGVSTKDANGEMRQEGEVLTDVIQRLAQIPDHTERIREANAILGRQAREFIPVIDNLTELQKTLDDYGIKVDENVIRKGDEAFHNIQAFSIALRQLRDEAAKEIGPITVKFLKLVLSGAQDTEGFWAGVYDYTVGAKNLLKPSEDTSRVIGKALTGQISPASVGTGGPHDVLTSDDLAHAPAQNRIGRPNASTLGLKGSASGIDAVEQQAKEQSAAAFQDSLAASDDKYGVTRAGKALEAAQKALIDVTKEGATVVGKDGTPAAASLADVKRAEAAVSSSLAEQRAAQKRVKDAQKAEEDARKLAEQQKQAQERVNRNTENGLQDPTARAILRSNDEAARFAGSPDKTLSKSVGESGLQDVIRTAHDEQVKGLARESKEEQEKTKAYLAASEKTMRENSHATPEDEDAKKTEAFENTLTRQTGAESVAEISRRGTSEQRLISGNPGLDATQKVIALEREEKSIADQKYQAETQAAQGLIDITKDQTERKKAQHEADLKNAEELAKVEEQYQERIAQIEDQRIEQFRSLIGGLFESIATRQPNALPNFVKSQVLGQAEKLTENAATTYLWQPLSKLSKSAGLSGPLTAGTWLGGGGKGAKDPLKTTAAPALVSAAADLTAAAHALAMSRGGGAGAGLPGVPAGTPAGTPAASATYYPRLPGDLGFIDRTGTTDAYGNTIPSLSGGGFSDSPFSGLSANLPPFSGFSDGATGSPDYLPGTSTIPGGFNASQLVPGILDNPAILSSPAASNSPLALFAKLATSNFGQGFGSIGSGNAIATLFGSGGGSSSDGLPGADATPADGIGGGLSAPALPGFDAGSSVSASIGAGVAIAGTLITGGLTAYNDFKKGGLGGALSGSGAIAGTAAALDPEPISKTVLAVAAIALPLIGGFFNGPQHRANQINTELGQAQYNAPQALNVTQSSGGTFTDFDARGNIRTSDFSAVPTVREGSTWEQTHGLFGGPPTFYQVPGGQTSQFGAVQAPTAPVVQHVYQAGAIQTIDATSFSGLLHRSSAAVGDAAATALQNSHARLASEVQRSAASG